MSSNKGRVKGNRGARVSESASQYSLHVSYSNCARSHGSPSSCVAKLAYDFQLNSANESRVAFVYVSASKEHAAIANNMISFGKACEETAGRQRTSRQMRHIMVALPGEGLSDQGCELLAKAICDLIRRLCDDQPVFGAGHRPPKGERNLHLHISHGLRLIRMHSATEYSLGERIMLEQRPEVRKAAGLPATSHQDLRTLRASVAELIANALAAEHADPQLVERWRCGHLPLQSQVRCAQRRGDLQFIKDNVFRDATQHEGYGGGARYGSWVNRSMGLSGHSSSRLPSPGVGAKAVTIAMVEIALTVAKRRGIRRLAFFRMLALDHDVIVRWTRRKRRDGSKGAIAGLSFQLIGGPIFLGRNIGFPLNKVCEVLGISPSDKHLRQGETDIVQKYLVNYAADATELRAEFEGRATAAILLRMLVQKADLLAAGDQVNELHPSQDLKTLDPTVERSNLRRLIEELRLPLSADERELRDKMILQTLDLDDDLRAYVHRNLAIPLHVAGNSYLEDDYISASPSSPDASNSDIEDQESSDGDWSERRSRQKSSS